MDGMMFDWREKLADVDDLVIVGRFRRRLRAHGGGVSGVFAQLAFQAAAACVARAWVAGYFRFGHSEMPVQVPPRLS
jgi:hypothetical protein